MTQLTHKILLKIGSHWNGIGLGFTCHELVSVLNPDRHATLHQHADHVVSRLPNKQLHGATLLGVYGGIMRAHITCDRGAVVAVGLTRPSNVNAIASRQGIHRGYGWTWSNGTVYLHSDPQRLQMQCAQDDIVSALETITRDMPDGETRTLNAHAWPGLVA